MESLSLTDARAQLPQLLDRVAAGETFTITRHGLPVAVLAGHDEWVKTKTHDVVARARELGAQRRSLPREPFTETIDIDADAWIAELRADREEDDADDPRGAS